MQVDSIEQGARDFLQIPLYLMRRAVALLLRVREVTARAGVHRRYEHEAAWIYRAAFNP